MKDAGNGPSKDGFEVEISAIEPGQDDERAATSQIALAQGLSRKARARRGALAVGALLVALLVLASVPSLRGQALSLFGGASSPTPTPGWFSYAPLTPPPTPGPGWTLAGPQYASSIAFAPGAPETAYACGVEQAAGSQPVPIRVGISRDYGHTWQMFSTPAVGGSCNLSVDPTNARDVMLIVSLDNQCASQTPSKLYRTFDGGAHWSRWSLPPAGPNQSSALLCEQWAWVGSTLYIAPILSIDLTYRRLAISIAGQAFAWLNLQSLFVGVRSDPTINELLATNTTLYALVGSQTDATNCCWFVQSHDNGVSWSRFDPVYQRRAVFLMGTSVDGRTLLGQALYNAPPETNGYVRSTDGGATWSVLAPRPDGLVAGIITAAPDGTVYAEFDQNLSSPENRLPLGIYKVAPGERSGYMSRPTLDLGGLPLPGIRKDILLRFGEA